MIKPEPVPAVPRMTAKVAKAAFPKGNLYLRLREEFGALYEDADFAELFPSIGQPGVAPWRLALVTVFQFLENLSDRQAADAVRGRIDWKYALSLELDDPGFDFSVLSEFRARVVEGGKSELILDRMLEHFKTKGLLKKRGKQRTDSTHVLGHVRFMSRLELLGETLRAALNQIATADPEWLLGTGAVTEEWFKRYDRPVNEIRLPESKSAREALGISIGEDGFALLDALGKAPKTNKTLLELDKVKLLKQQWERHYERKGKGSEKKVRMRDGPEAGKAAKAIQSPYDPEARYCNRRIKWIGYKVHLTETCDQDSPHLLVNVRTAAAPEHDKHGTPAIHQSLAARDLLPERHYADTGYANVEAIVQAARDHDVRLIGPPRDNPSWQTKTEGGITHDDFKIDWEKRTASCPNGHTSSSVHNVWRVARGGDKYPMVEFVFTKSGCMTCGLRPLCTRNERTGKHVTVLPRELYEALREIRGFLQTEEGQLEYNTRQGIEGTISQAVRAFPFRRSRYRGQSKTQLQQLATGAAINLVRVDDWLQGKPRGETRVSRFARLKPQPSAVA